MALFSLSNTELEEENPAFSKQAIVAKLLDRPKKLLATILIANNAINITSVLIFSILAEVWFGGLETEWLRFVLEVGAVTFLILLFGEIFPKVYANRNPIGFANFMAIPLNVLDKICQFKCLRQLRYGYI